MGCIALLGRISLSWKDERIKQLLANLPTFHSSRLPKGYPKIEMYPVLFRIFLNCAI
jgi:hypothetical protein